MLQVYDRFAAILELKSTIKPSRHHVSELTVMSSENHGSRSPSALYVPTHISNILSYKVNTATSNKIFRKSYVVYDMINIFLRFQYPNFNIKFVVFSARFAVCFYFSRLYIKYIVTLMNCHSTRRSHACSWWRHVLTPF